MKLITIIKAGVEYARVWPAKPELNAIFPESKVIFLTTKATKVLPALAFMTALVQYKLLGIDFIGQILAMFLLLASMPFQGFYWLGIRAESLLPPSLVSWGNEIREQMHKKGSVDAVPMSPKNYLDLGKLLQLAYQQLDQSVMRRWF